MILVTVGMQLGFERLIEAMDALAPEIEMPIIAQTGIGTFKPIHMQAHERIAPEEFEALVQKASLIVSHAGIGTILTAQRFAKPVVLIPRRADRGEHRNDHQLATVKGLEGRPGIWVAMDETELAEKIDEALSMKNWSVVQSETARELHTSIANFIETGRL